MEKEIKSCDECGDELKRSQYARREGVDVDGALVCRNYPACSKAEKEVD